MFDHRKAQLEEMASEFQLGARLFLPSQEDILPCITALYLTSSAESESESDAEYEWKEAIRVALEDVSRPDRN